MMTNSVEETKRKLNPMAERVMWAYFIRHMQKPTTRKFRKARKAERQNKRLGRLHNVR